MGKTKYPSARVGNYRAPVDTVGMDESMKQTMGFGKKAAAKPRKVAPPKKKR